MKCGLLIEQLQKLKDEMVGKSEKKNHPQIEETTGHSSTDAKIDFEVKNIASKALEGMLSDDDSGIKAELLVLDEENELLKMVEPAVDSSLTSSEDWGSLDSDDLINQPTESYPWWDFWC